MNKPLEIDDVFTPSTPVEILDIFAGRKNQIEKINRAFNEKGAHIMLYGERGVGKTSLANIIRLQIDRSTNMCFKINCNPNDDFKALWYKMFNQIQVVNYKEYYNLTARIFQEDLDSNYVVRQLKQLENKCLYIFDEFDQIQDEETKQDFTYLIKQLSDEGLNTTIMLVGIAENIAELLKEHRSLERCLKEIKIQLMSEDEIKEIIEKGLEKLNIEIDESVKKEIINLSEGYPRYAHLLSKYCCIDYIDKKKKVIDKESLNYATQQSLDEAEESIRREYQKATINDMRNNYDILLLACALADKDEFGAFTHTNIVNVLKKIYPHKVKNNYRNILNSLCENEKGKILIKRGKTRHKYEFRNPLMQIYIKIRNHGKSWT